jgi:hypothetical protein
MRTIETIAVLSVLTGAVHAQAPTEKGRTGLELTHITSRGRAI